MHKPILPAPLCALYNSSYIYPQVQRAVQQNRLDTKEIFNDSKDFTFLKVSYVD